MLVHSNSLVLVNLCAPLFSIHFGIDLTKKILCDCIHSVFFLLWKRKGNFNKFQPTIYLNQIKIMITNLLQHSDDSDYFSASQKVREKYWLCLIQSNC